MQGGCGVGGSCYGGGGSDPMEEGNDGPRGEGDGSDDREGDCTMNEASSDPVVSDKDGGGGGGTSLTSGDSVNREQSKYLLSSNLRALQQVEKAGGETAGEIVDSQ